MPRIDIGSRNLHDVLREIRSVVGAAAVVEISEECLFADNLLAFKIIKSEARRRNCDLTFVAKSPKYRGLAKILNDGENFGFVKGYDVASETDQDSTKPTFPLTSIFRRLPWPKFRPRLFFVLLAVSLSLAAVVLLLYFYLPKATISLSVDSEALVKSIEVTASASAQVRDVGNRVIPALILSEEGKKSGGASATGTKEVGEKARGSLTVFNKTEGARAFPLRSTFDKGRTQGADLIFLTDREFSVPAESGGVSGVATVSATAEKIGDDYNIPIGSILSLGGQSTNSFIAEAAQSFSGGSRRMVTVVTEDDQKKLLAAVRADLENSLSVTIKNKIVGGQKLEADSTTFTVLSKSFDKSVSQEASNFNLDLTEKAAALVYSEGDLRDILGEILRRYIPENYDLFGKDLAVEILSVRNLGESLIFSTKVQGYIVPKIDETRIVREISGLPLKGAQKYLSGLAGVSSYRIDLSPRLPFFSFLPRRTEAIKIEIGRR